MKIPFISSMFSQRADNSSSNGASFNKTNAVARLCALFFSSQSILSGVQNVKDMYAHRKDVVDSADPTKIAVTAYTRKQQLQKGALAASKIAAGTLVAYKSVK